MKVTLIALLLTAASHLAKSQQTLPRWRGNRGKAAVQNVAATDVQVAAITAENQQQEAINSAVAAAKAASVQSDRARIDRSRVDNAIRFSDSRLKRFKGSAGQAAVDDPQSRRFTPGKMPWESFGQAALETSEGEGKGGNGEYYYASSGSKGKGKSKGGSSKKAKSKGKGKGKRKELSGPPRTTSTSGPSAPTSSPVQAPTSSPVQAPTSPTVESSTFNGSGVTFGSLSTCDARTTLTNGSTLSVGLNLDNAFTAGTPSTKLTANFQGETGLVFGAVFHPFVHISYVVDVSGSTTADCDGTRTILQCETDGIFNLDIAALVAGTTVDISFTAFASDFFPADLDLNTAGVQILAPPGDPVLIDVLLGLKSAAGTRYQNATRAAIEAVTLSVKDPAVTRTFVVFLSDGVENNPLDLSPEIAALNALGTIVYSFAVGTGVTCQGNLVALANETGGFCTEVADAIELSDALQAAVIPDRSLAATKITLNGTPLPLSEMPSIGNGPFNLSTGDVPLDLGLYQVCLESTTGDGFDDTACCVEFEVV